MDYLAHYLHVAYKSDFQISMAAILKWPQTGSPSDLYLMELTFDTSINKVWGLMSQTMLTSAQPQANPAITKKHPYNVGPTSKTLHICHTKVCARWERPTAHPGRHESENKLNTNTFNPGERASIPSVEVENCKKKM